MVMDELGFAFQIVLKDSSQELMIVTVQAIGCDRVPSLRSGFQKKLVHADRLSNSSN
jgi:hypothetical protein